ncbi:unnamed protein product [Allacma fusca]|uniref:Uncharacterized protein n=1 Tax=Allacma fusca TaxID=39272 RepID=A0A8J2KQN4_9HEXA|nr:unnamed protein product [Allacma fusca]
MMGKVVGMMGVVVDCKVGVGGGSELCGREIMELTVTIQSNNISVVPQMSDRMNRLGLSISKCLRILKLFVSGQ